MYGLVPYYLHNATTVDRVARQIEDPRGTIFWKALFSTVERVQCNRGAVRAQEKSRQNMSEPTGFVVVCAPVKLE